MKKVLVTGAGGFIGSHLVEELLRQGRDVRAFVHYNSFGSWGWLETLADEVKLRLDVFPGDVRDGVCVREAMKDCAEVMHLAALIGIPYSYQAPDSYVATNVQGTLNIVQAARELGIRKVVVTSTSEVYGTAQFVPITEEHPLVGQSPYSASKIGADQIALSYHRSFGTPVAVVRPFNTFGPRQSTRAVIPTIITQIAKGERKVRLGALKPRRDLTFVGDTVLGMIAALDSEASLGEVVNLGVGFDVSIEELARLVAQVMKVDIDLELENERLRPDSSEVYVLRSDNSKARKLLGWEPRLSGLAGLQGSIEETVRWFSVPSNLAFYPRSSYAV